MECNSTRNKITLPAGLRAKLEPLAREKDMSVEVYAVALLNRKANEKGAKKDEGRKG